MKKLFGQAETDWELKGTESEHLFTNALLRAGQSRVISIFVDAVDEAGSHIARVGVVFLVRFLEPLDFFERIFDSIFKLLTLPLVLSL